MNERTNGSQRDKGPHRPRHRTRAEERIDAIDTSAPTLTQQVDELRERAERAEQEAADSKLAWQRTAADFANYRRRTEQQRAEELGLANESLLLKVLSVADDLDRAVAHVPVDEAGSAWVEGITAIDRKLRSLLDSEGVTPIEAEGEPFDPRQHEAVSQEETTEAPDQSVLREYQRGYRVRDRVLRPALVAVARNEGSTASQRVNDGSPDEPATKE